MMVLFDDVFAIARNLSIMSIHHSRPSLQSEQVQRDVPVSAKARGLPIPAAFREVSATATGLVMLL